MKKKLCCLFAAAALLCACGAETPAYASSVPQPVGGSTRRDAVLSEELQFNRAGDGSVFTTVQTSEGTFRLVLYPDIAPLAVENFCTLAKEGYYDGTPFHRAVRDFAIQGGDAGGQGGGATIWGAPYTVERSDAVRHYSGALCAAAAGGVSAEGFGAILASQFYILATPQDNLDEAALEGLLAAGEREEVVQAYRQAGGAPWMDNRDTVFGQVIDGMDVVDAIARRAPQDGEEAAGAPVTVDSITVENWPPAEWQPEE